MTGAKIRGNMDEIKTNVL